MKQYLIFGVIFLIQVNFISCVNPRTRSRFQEDDNNRIQFDDVDMEPVEEIETEPSNGLRRSARSIPYNSPEGDLLRRDKREANEANETLLISECTFAECQTMGGGFYATEMCSNIYCVCMKGPGQAYLQNCPLGFIFHADKQICINKKLAEEAEYCVDYYQ